MEELKQFYTDMHCPGTRLHASTLDTVLAYDGTKLSDVLLAHPLENLYFLAGIDSALTQTAPHPRHVSDQHILRKKHVFFDFDIRKDLLAQGQEITNEEIRWLGIEFSISLSKHPILSTWKYIIFTGNGLHVYYVGDEFPIHIHNYKVAYTEWARRISRTVGYEADTACKNPARIARMPGSYNNKNGQHTLVEILLWKKDEPSSPLIPHILTYTPPMKTVTTQEVIHFCKTTDLKNSLIQLGVDIRDDNHVYENNERTSMKLNPEGNYIHRFSGKPGSGDLISFIVGTRSLTFNEAVHLIAHELMKSELVLSQERKTALEIQKKAKLPDFMAKYNKPLARNNKTWGLQHLDERFDRPRDGDFILFLGEAGTGKTSFAIYSACINAKQGVRTLFLSFEMATENLLTRYINTRAMISEEQRISAKYDPDQLRVMKDVIAEVNNENLTWLDMRDVQDPKNWELVKALMDDYDMIYIDNFSRIVPRSEQETAVQSHISENLSNYVEATNKTIIMIHHFAKRANPKAERGLEARGSQKLIDDISIHVSIARDVMMENYEEGANFMDFSIRKNRYGKTGTAQIKWDNGKYY